jgi:hypothetical protein
MHAIVPRQAVGDRSPSGHETALFDIDNRFADVCEIGDVLAYLEQMLDSMGAVR